MEGKPGIFDALGQEETNANMFDLSKLTCVLEIEERIFFCGLSMNGPCAVTQPSSKHWTTDANPGIEVNLGHKGRILATFSPGEMSWGSRIDGKPDMLDIFGQDDIWETFFVNVVLSCTYSKITISSGSLLISLDFSFTHSTLRFPAMEEKPGILETWGLGGRSLVIFGN